MKKISILLFIILLSSCTRKSAETKFAPNSLDPNLGYRALEAFDPQMFKSEIEDGTAILLPHEDDFSARTKYIIEDGAVKTVDNQQTEDWSWKDSKNVIDQVFEGTPFFSKLPREILASESNFDKSRKVTILVLAAGEVSDLLFIEKKQLENEQDLAETKAEKEFLAQNEELNLKFRCFNPITSEDSKKIQCTFGDSTGTAPFILAQTCQQLKQFKFELDNETDKKDFKNLERGCPAAKQEAKKPFDKSIALVDTKRKAAKSIVTDILEDLKNHYTGISYIYVIYSATQAEMSSANVPVAKFVWNDTLIECGVDCMELDLPMAKDLNLVIDSYDGRLEKRSVKNGDIFHFRFKTSTEFNPLGRKMLDLGINLGNGQYLKTSLSITDQKYFDLRFTGEMKSTGLDGVERVGAMKLEVRRK